MLSQNSTSFLSTGVVSKVCGLHLHHLRLGALLSSSLGQTCAGSANERSVLGYRSSLARLGRKSIEIKIFGNFTNS
jgi:hypothetical protein